MKGKTYYKVWWRKIGEYIQEYHNKIREKQKKQREKEMKKRKK